MSEVQSKIAPNSKEAEMMVLGTMISNPSALQTGAELRFTDFFFNEHRTIFRILQELANKNTPVEVQIVCEELKKEAKLKEVGGIPYIVTLAQYAGTSGNIEEYCAIIRAHAFARKQIELARTLCEDLLDSKNNPFVLAEKYQQKQIELARQYSTDDKVTIGEVLDGSKSKNGSLPLIELLKQRQDFYKLNGKPFSTGIPTGFIDLDSKAILLEDTHLIVIAGRPSMGKTSFALTIAENVCLTQNLPVAIFSLEMGADQLAERIISSQTNISLIKMKQGTFTNAELQKFQSAINQVSAAPMYIYDQGAATISSIVLRARQLKEKKNIQLLIIDYLQLLGVDGGGDSRQYEVAEISRRLKLLAMELRIPILCIAQLSRKVEERNDKRPLLSDLRDSGQIEQDADAVLFLYRRDYYNKTDHPGQAEVIIAKNRHGPTTTVALSFLQETGRFVNLAPISTSMYQLATDY